MNTLPAQRDLVLVGGGHSHALALRMLAMRPVPGTRLTLVSPDVLAAYSGMLPGLVAGHYSVAQTHVDLPRLCQWAGARWVQGRVRALDIDARELTLDDGSRLGFDLLSLDVGATPELASVPGAAEHAIAVKPVADFRQRWSRFLEGLDPRRSLAVCVVGGGAGGAEMALAIAHALRQRGQAAEVTLVCAGAFLQGYPARLRRQMRARALALGVILRDRSRVHRVTPGIVHGEAGEQRFDALFWCTGAAAPGFLRDTGLALDAAGFVQVDRQLRSVSHPQVFAAGDCAAFPLPLPKAGVYAVRQAPVLAHNLRAALSGGRLRDYRPQRRFLSLLSAGGRDAVGSRGVWTLSGAWVWRWKDHIDRRFMTRFEALPPRRMPTPAATAETMHCAGCGAKVGGEALSDALKGLQPLRGEGVVSGLEEREDASSVRWPAGTLLVQSHDYFPAFVDDPALFGRITVLHALSDLYAVNARPHSALATVTMPRHHPRLQGRDLKRLMRAMVEELDRAGCTLLGGHTLEGEQLAAGLTVNGQVEEADLFHKAGARPGDALVLTKPLGAGILLAGHTQLRCRGPWLEGALAAMLRSNASAAAVFAGHGVRACTDITGFGLLGHLQEMCRAGEVGARLLLADLPALEGALELAEAGVASTLKPANDLALLHCKGQALVADDPRGVLLTDPQTSGGLLAAVPRAQLEACLRALALAGQMSAVVGEVLAEPGVLLLSE